jgi:hypothetical protein
MTQSALTVTPENPTPPTNMSFIGTTPPTDPAQAYFDDGAAGSQILFAAKVAAAGSGTSVDAEGRGTETSYTVVPPPTAYDQPVDTVSCGCGPAYSTTPNANHASYVGATTPTITGSPAPNNVASGAGTTAITITGTNFTPSSKVYIDGKLQNANYVSATSLTVANAPKLGAAGTRSVVVTNGFNGPSSAASIWTFT